VELASCLGPADVKVSATSVYFDCAGTGTSTLMKVSLNGGTPTPALAQNDPNLDGIALDATHLYWTDLSGSVMKVGLGGGTPITLVADAGIAGDVAVNATSVCFTTQFDLMRVGLDGAALITVKPRATANNLAVDATSLYWSTPMGSIVDAVMKVGLDGGTPTTLASVQPLVTGIAVDATSVYWVTHGVTANGTVMKVGLDGGTPTVLASGLDGPDAIAVDASGVYWVEDYDGRVMRVGLDGGTPTVLASGQSEPISIALDATSVYWTAYGGGTVMKVAK
jgi:hypothetical protein